MRRRRPPLALALIPAVGLVLYAAWRVGQPPAPVLVATPRAPAIASATALSPASTRAADSSAVQNRPATRPRPPQNPLAAPPPGVAAIDVKTWPGYHGGETIWLPVSAIRRVRPHPTWEVVPAPVPPPAAPATRPPSRRQPPRPAAPPTTRPGITGSAVHVGDDSCWYTQEPPDSLTRRLAALGWTPPPPPPPPRPGISGPGPGGKR